MGQKNYLSIVSHYESCLEKYGDTHLGVDWPKSEDADTRHRIMLEVIQPDASGQAKLLDFGCGTSFLYEYILRNNIPGIEYSGLDLSPKFIQLSRAKFPMNKYYYADILDEGTDIPNFDYIVMNGVFTEKRQLSFDEMFSYFKRAVTKVFNKANVAIAFNVMSKQVAWERDDLFHLPFDSLANFLTSELTRDFVIRNDYGLYEYTTYVYQRRYSK